MIKHKSVIGIIFTAGLLTACANDGTLIGSSLTTSSVDPSAQTKTAAKIDPACVQLATRIDALRKEGFVERVEKASTGKTGTVQVKRESLAKMAELEKANADFQAKCSTIPMAATQAAAPAVATPAATATAQATHAAASAASKQTTAAVNKTASKAATTAVQQAAPAGQP